MTHQQPPAGRLIYPVAQKHTQGHQPLTAAPAEPGPTASNAIETFAESRRSNSRLIISGLISAVLVALIAVLVNSFGAQNPTPTPTPASPGKLPGMPFVDSRAKAEGRWQILETVWTPGGVQIRLQVDCDTGRAGYGFRAFTNNQSMSVVQPTGGGPQPVLTHGEIPAGSQATGWVEFNLPRAEFTLVLTDNYDRQLSALLVKP